MKSDLLFRRAERVRERATELLEQFVALRELRQLERDLRAVTRKLARVIEPAEMAQIATEEAISRLINEADDVTAE